MLLLAKAKLPLVMLHPGIPSVQDAFLKATAASSRNKAITCLSAIDSLFGCGLKMMMDPKVTTVKCIAFKPLSSISYSGCWMNLEGDISNIQISSKIQHRTCNAKHSYTKVTKMKDVSEV